MSEKVEQVARAMEDTWQKAELGSEGLGPITAEILARAAIEAMRIPPPKPGEWQGICTAMWNERIDAALRD
jgi:hypothetical protein